MRSVACQIGLIKKMSDIVFALKLQLGFSMYVLNSIFSIVLLKLTVFKRERLLEHFFSANHLFLCEILNHPNFFQSQKVILTFFCETTIYVCSFVLNLSWRNDAQLCLWADYANGYNKHLYQIQLCKDNKTTV